MTTITRLTFALCALLSLSATVDAQLPSTPPGRLLSAFLEVTNKPDRASMQAFVDKSQPSFNVDQGLETAKRFGGFDVKQVQRSSDTAIAVLAQARGPGKEFVLLTLRVKPDAPDRIAAMSLRPSEPPADLAPPKLTAAEAEVARQGVPFRQLSAYLEVFNSGDRERIRRFIESSYPSANVDQETRFAAQTGGFDFRALERATATSATGLVQEHNSDQFARFTVVVDSAEPHKIARINLSAIPRPAEFAIPRMSEAELVSALRAKLDTDSRADRFSGTALVAKLGSGAPKVLFSQAYGQSDRDKKTLNTLDSRFRIGSMNKMFTATSIMQLVQAGKIKLTDPLGKYVTDYPNKDVASKVTIHQLLTHTGGTGDIFGPEYAAHRLELKTLNDYVTLYGKRGLAFEPGSRWQYSNYGMVLLGVVIERVSGQSYYDYVAKHIFAPAGMTHSGSEPESEAVAGRTLGYMRQGTAWMPNTETLPYRGTSAGGGYSTVGDLLRFADALMGHKLLNAENTTLLTTGKAEVGEGRKYAYGFEDDLENGVRMIGHSGGAPGMNGELRIYPESGYVVAVLSNFDPPAASQIASYVQARLPR